MRYEGHEFDLIDLARGVLWMCRLELVIDMSSIIARVHCQLITKADNQVWLLIQSVLSLPAGDLEALHGRWGTQDTKPQTASSVSRTTWAQI